jgi:hypothetical protein
MCRKTPDPSPTTEKPRRSGRRTTALQPEESAELTATSGSAQTALKIYKLEPYLLNGTPFTTSVPCAVTNQNAAIGVFVCTRGNQIVVDFGTHTVPHHRLCSQPFIDKAHGRGHSPHRR